jgi:hypothetical protein
MLHNGAGHNTADLYVPPIIGYSPFITTISYPQPTVNALHKPVIIHFVHVGPNENSPSTILALQVPWFNLGVMKHS